MITVAQLDSLPERIREKIAFGPECWIWIAGHGTRGYGKAKLNGKQYQAHRLLYILLIGPIPDKITLDHTCKIKSCVNPEHMDLMTQKEASEQGNKVRITNYQTKTECSHGHLWTDENTYIPPDGKRQCRECRHIQKLIARGQPPRPRETNGCRTIACRNATGDICDCSCNGVNHGISNN